MTTTADDIWRILAELAEAQKKPSNLAKKPNANSSDLAKKAIVNSSNSSKKPTDKLVL